MIHTPNTLTLIALLTSFAPSYSPNRFITDLTPLHSTPLHSTRLLTFTSRLHLHVAVATVYRHGLTRRADQTRPDQTRLQSCTGRRGEGGPTAHSKFERSISNISNEGIWSNSDKALHIGHVWCRVWVEIPESFCFCFSYTIQIWF